MAKLTLVLWMVVVAMLGPVHAGPVPHQEKTEVTFKAGTSVSSVSKLANIKSYFVDDEGREILHGIQLEWDEDLEKMFLKVFSNGHELTTLALPNDLYEGEIEE